MKKIICYLMILCGLLVYSCKDMDSTYEEFIIPNGKIYPQKADSMKVYTGNHRVRVTWQKAKDPKVVKARVYWDNYTDSIETDIPADLEIISVDINNLEEDVYTFCVKTFDAKGNVSLPSEKTKRVYGEDYLAALTGRRITSIVPFIDRVELVLEPATDLARYEVAYPVSSGEIVHAFFPVTQNRIVLNDYLPGGEFTAISYIVPEPDAIDEFVVETHDVFPENYILDTTGWTVNANTNIGGGMPEYVIDRDEASFWFGNLPNWKIELDMKSFKQVEVVAVLQHPDELWVKTAKISFSIDGITWGNSQNLTFPEKSAAFARQDLVLETPVLARHIRIERVAGFEPSPTLALLTEIYIYGHNF